MRLKNSTEATERFKIMNHWESNKLFHVVTYDEL